MAGFQTNATIAAAGTVSTPVQNPLSSETLGMVMPAAFTGLSVSFQVSLDNVTYQPLYDATNTLVSVTVVAGRSYVLPTALAAYPWIKIVSAAAEAAQRVITVVGHGDLDTH